VPGEGWLADASRDTLGRELRLWETGLLADLPHQLATPLLAWARDDRDGGSGALLMRDVRGHLWREPLRVPVGRLPAQVLALLDRLALMHERFWNDARLLDPAFGLMPADAALTLMGPNGIAGRIASGDGEPYLPLAAAGWEVFFQLASSEAADVLRDALHSPERYVGAIGRLPWTLVHGDVWGPNLGWLPRTRAAPRAGSRLLLLDWALAMAGPATYDPLWLCGTWHVLYPPRVLAAYRARLERHLAARAIALSGRTWLALADAGYLRTALTCGEALGRAADEAPAGAARTRAEARVRWWAERAVRGARRLLTVTGTAEN
jgi:Phosphotransferase enzyme family